jgi:hypothetical protein
MLTSKKELRIGQRRRPCNLLLPQLAPAQFHPRRALGVRYALSFDDSMSRRRFAARSLQPCRRPSRTAVPAKASAGVIPDASKDAPAKMSADAAEISRDARINSLASFFIEIETGTRRQRDRVRHTNLLSRMPGVRTGQAERKIRNFDQQHSGWHGPFRGLDAPLALQTLYHERQMAVPFDMAKRLSS